MIFPMQLQRLQSVARCHYSMNLCLVQPEQPGRHREPVGVDRARQLTLGVAVEVLIQGMRGSVSVLAEAPNVQEVLSPSYLVLWICLLAECRFRSVAICARIRRLIERLTSIRRSWRRAVRR